MSKPTVAIIGASADPRRSGGKALRAHVAAGYDVYPVTTEEKTIQSLPCLKTILDVPVIPDRVSLHLPPLIGLRVLADIAQRGCRELWVDPDADGAEVRLQIGKLGLNGYFGCSYAEPAGGAVTTASDVSPKTSQATAAPSPLFDLWAGLTEEQVALIRSRLTECRVAKGHFFIRQGDRDRSVYIVQRGQIEVRRGGTSLATLGPDSVVGEMALLNREPRYADVVARSLCRLWRLSAEDFEDLCKQCPPLKLVMTRLVAHRLNWSRGEVLARRIGPYEVVAEVGVGGMGWVFRAVSQGVSYALKMLPHPLVQRRGFLERYRLEARALRDLRHPNIVALHDSVEVYGTVFLVLEFVDGVSVAEWARRQGRPFVADVRCIARSMTRALRAAHAQGIVHRDVKPSNVMIRGDGVVKLLDFGIATLLGESSSHADFTLTPAYAAPEQTLGQKCAAESDFFSLGVMVYELLTGSRPFEVDPASGVPVSPQDRLEMNPSLPADLRRWVNAALTRKPAERRIELDRLLPAWDDRTETLLVSRPPVPPPATTERLFPSPVGGDTVRVD